MHFNELLLAHTRWKARLRSCINGQSTEDLDQLDPDQVSRSDLCDLGKWINGEGQQYQGNPHFDKLIIDHAYFHKCAGEVVRKVIAGNTDGANEMMSAHGEFYDVSSAVVSAVNQLYKEVITSKQ